MDCTGSQALSRHHSPCEGDAVATRHNERAVTRAYLIGAVLLASALASFAQSPAASPVGLPAIAAFDRLPLVEDDAQFLYASSYDRTGGNDDGFKGTYSALSVDARGEHVIFDAHGALRLRRLRDQARPQDAEVWVDGRLAGRWSSSAINPDRRWADDDFLLPSSLTIGRASLEIEVRAVGGPWSEFRYELWATR